MNPQFLHKLQQTISASVRLSKQLSVYFCYGSVFYCITFLVSTFFHIFSLFHGYFYIICVLLIPFEMLFIFPSIIINSSYIFISILNSYLFIKKSSHIKSSAVLFTFQGFSSKLKFFCCNVY